MTLEKMQIVIGQVLRIGVCLAFVLVLLGGGRYLWEHGRETMSFQVFSTAPTHFIPVQTIFLQAFHFSALGAIQLGLLTLVLVQFVRVFLTLWMFIRLHERLFMLICLFVFSVMVYSLFWYHPNF